MDKTYAEWIETVLARVATDWTDTERDAFRALAATAFEGFWKPAKREPFDLQALRAAASRIATSRATSGIRLLRLVNYNYGLQVLRQIDPER